MAQLTVKGIEALTRPGRYGDGGTLFLVVHPGGSKSWVQRLTVHGRRHDIGLGPADPVRGRPVVAGCWSIRWRRTRRREIDGRVIVMFEHENDDACCMWSTAARLCPCGRPTVTPYHDHCAACIRTAKPADKP